MLTLTTAYQPFPPSLRAELIALQTAGDNEIQREAVAANLLVQHYAECVHRLLIQSNISADRICAIGVHGQTIRHRPDLGYTRQTNSPALLAELTGIDVIADFRSRDIAAGGQGAPLVPAFHRSVFFKAGEKRVIANIGGISNITLLHNGPVAGFDTGPGNVLMDAWVARHCNQPYDAGGAWAASGSEIPALLGALRNESFFAQSPPKSTGRDLFHPAWLDATLSRFPNAKPADVQATLAALTATTLADAINGLEVEVDAVYVCGGGAYNLHLMQRLQNALQAVNTNAPVHPTDMLGVPANQVEALAFAWLAQRFIERQPGNLPSVTGAREPRILGALYPA